MVCVPSGTEAEFQIIPNGDTMSSAPKTKSSIINFTPATRMLSRADALIFTLFPRSGTEAEFQIIPNGDTMSSAPKTKSSIINFTPATRMLSRADALIFTLFPRTKAPAAGEDIDTVGGVMSVDDVFVVKVKSPDTAWLP